ncbi:MAG: bifunctional diguanylate cyclase/phosphodiesterase, partial [Clostridia bacterium]|nr:bifunctional diguanylate cyclase/phosphodiesterase [Clostridia bacterium]
MEKRVLVSGDKVRGGRKISLDRLTGMPDMRSFYDFAEKRIKICDGSREHTIVYFNIEKFKTFNDRYGYEAGDEFLCDVGRVIQKEFEGCIVARFADDHFVVLTEQSDITEKIKRIHAAVHNYQKDIIMEIKAGIYEMDSNEESIGKACDRAKLACDIIKHDYEKDYRIYDISLRQQLLIEKYITDNIDKAIECEYLKVYYQPIVRVLSNDTCGMESLVRWDDPEMGFLSPADFIGVLEKNHMIHKLDTYVINKVCYDLQNAAKENRSMVPVSVNLSRLDFQLCDIYQVIDDAINKYGIDKKMFHIEVTESTLNDDSKSLSSTIARFREDGYEVWLDDFGSDYSTLNTLQDYSFDVLKIDMNFFASFSTNEKSRIIITAVVDMAKKLKIRTVAEGIETEEEYHFLKQIGCDKAQGYYLCKPMPLELLHDILGKVETRGEKHYYDVLGRINLLSTDPLSSHRQET